MCYRKGYECLLAGLPVEQLSRLQRVQNCAARLISKKRKSAHITPVLRELHWLPVKHRWQFKIGVLVFRYFEGTLPSYLSNTLQLYQPSRSLHSSTEKLLRIPRRKMKSVGERSFSFLTPTVWNSLPSFVRSRSDLVSFKSALKTHFFNQAY